MRYGSVCSGIEAATVAWRPLGWTAQWFAEIDPFASAVLAHHYPGVPNYGDFTKLPADAGPIDVLVGGTPCQSFSVAGRRGGLDDDRGRLAIAFTDTIRRFRPRWVVWENVAGVLTSNAGLDFAAFLNSLGECGYGYGYRVLDGQHFGTPQRRRRVYVVGCAGTGCERAADVLFDAPGGGGDFTAGRTDGDTHPADVSGGPETDHVAQTLNARDWKGAGSYMNGSIQSVQLVGGRLRRLTLTERERLMGFPDDYTDVPYAGPGKDRERFKVTGNSMCVPVMRWIGRRIAAADGAG